MKIPRKRELKSFYLLPEKMGLFKKFKDFGRKGITSEKNNHIKNQRFNKTHFIKLSLEIDYSKLFQRKVFYNFLTMFIFSILFF